MRRCGKSSILDVFINHLMSNGVNKAQIIKINFEDLDFEDILNINLLDFLIKDTKII